MNHLIDQSLIEQNPHWDGKLYNKHKLSRMHDESVLSELYLQEIQIITGIRRSGKSTLLHTIINQLIKDNNPKSILYINLDDPNYTDMWNKAGSLNLLITSAEKLTACRIDYLFLDEIQNVEDWENYVKNAYDIQRFRKIFITGSNGDLLTSQYATLLSGRYIKTHIYPLSFRELLLNNHINDYLELVKNKPKVLALLDIMLNFGGFPRIQNVDYELSRKKILKSYYETILLKGCIANHEVRNVKSLMNLSHYLINHVSTQYSYNSLGKALDITENTSKNFIQILQNSYLVDELKNFTFSLKLQSKAKKKIYCIDNGLISATTFKFNHNYGKLLENLVYSELKKQNVGEIYFYHDHIECDFIVHQQQLGVQVCYQLDDTNRDRELKGLKTAMTEFSLKKGIIITYDQEASLDNVEVIPFWKWCFIS